MNDAELVALVQANLAGRIEECERVMGGMNNRAFRLRCQDGSMAFAKLFQPHKIGTRDRYTAEKRFYALCRATRPEHPIPDLMFFNDKARIIVTEWIHGQAVQQAGKGEVFAAADFIRGLRSVTIENSDYEDCRASESCSNVTEHIELIEQRVLSLSEIPGCSSISASAKQFAEGRLRDVWGRVRDALVEAPGIEHWARAETLFLSPSDLGFQNAIRDSSGRIVFFDFEHSGLDDLAKLASDFFCQARVPVSLDFFDSFTESITDGLPDALHIRERAWHLLPAYRVKWACILMNEFQPERKSTRLYAGRDLNDHRLLEQQLKGATMMIDSVAADQGLEKPA